MDGIFVRRLIDNKELQTTEFKSSFPGFEKTSELLAGFANTDGGFLLLGISDKGTVLGIKSDDLDSLQRKLAEAAAAVKPVLVVSVDVIDAENKKLVVVKVPKTSSGCHTFKGRLFVRMGSTTRQLEGSAQLEFLRDKGTLMFDEATTNASVQDIDEKKIRQYLKKRQQENFLDQYSIEDFLLNSRLASMNGELKIKNPAILLFGKQPQNFLPQSEIRAVCFKGDEKGGEVISSRILGGSLEQQIEDAISFIQKNTRQAFVIKPEGRGKRTQTFEYPYEVIREAIVNAVAHRDYFSHDAIQIHIYDTHIEISNPGSLLKGITKETLGRRSVLRNPTIYRLLRDYNYMEGLGQGIPKMCNLMRKAGLADPDFETDDFFFEVILSSKKVQKQAIEVEGDLKPRLKAALEYLRKNNTMKRTEYEKLAKVSYVTAINDLNELMKFEFIEKIGKYRGAYYVLKKR